MKKIHILAFDEMEVLDFAGPFEVFSVANELSDYALFDISVIGYRSETLRCRNGLRVLADRLFDPAEQPDVLIVPGGNGSRELLGDAELRSHIRRVHEGGRHILSVCSGALILASSGILSGMKVTTHREVIEELRSVSPDFETVTDARFCDNGNVILSAGISAGIDACLHFIARDFGDELMQRTRAYMEY